MNENKKFKIGDVVKLNSGSPTMTIVDIQQDGTCECKWISKSDEVKTEIFVAEALRAYKPAKFS